MKLVIIESPFKREALKKYLGSGYEVFATKGHIRDLPQKAFGIDLKHNLSLTTRLCQIKRNSLHS